MSNLGGFIDTSQNLGSPELCKTMAVSNPTQPPHCVGKQAKAKRRMSFTQSHRVNVLHHPVPPGHHPQPSAIICSFLVTVSCDHFYTGKKKLCIEHLLFPLNTWKRCTQMNMVVYLIFLKPMSLLPFYFPPL